MLVRIFPFCWVSKMAEVEAALVEMVSHSPILDKSGLSTTDNACQRKLKTISNSLFS